MRLIVLELYDGKRDTVENVDFEKRAILASGLNDSVSHVRITCAQPTSLIYTAAHYWRGKRSYNCYG